ncbi:uncharacterized protein EI97DRAFT_57362 [Westerdykella ornata]|uniref:Uncharacterized protein n=1 Tax=Westerdykella ornata TaxID=318751 RepID=A0A6A6JIR1_WESOR|nr:uncharacterized protein EI97DRAFT_57362 [Westerdykella ornata]KAF2275838.1 hypothetical protein EI97DRAFT_57362 [Westerdykella ornata]
MRAFQGSKAASWACFVVDGRAALPPSATSKAWRRGWFLSAPPRRPQLLPLQRRYTARQYHHHNRYTLTSFRPKSCQLAISVQQIPRYLPVGLPPRIRCTDSSGTSSEAPHPTRHHPPAAVGRKGQLSVTRACLRARSRG